jgi:hypothetical protein
MNVRTVEMFPAVRRAAALAVVSLESSSLLLLNKEKKIYINFKLFEQFPK